MAAQVLLQSRERAALAIVTAAVEDTENGAQAQKHDIRTRLESEGMGVSPGVLASDFLWLLDKELSALKNLLGINHVVDGRKEHGQLICAADE